MAVLVVSTVLAPRAAAATGPTVVATRSCFVNAGTPEPISLAGAGWTPGDQIDITSTVRSLVVSGTLTANAAGDISGTIPGAIPDRGGAVVVRARLTATDGESTTTPDPTAGTTVTVTNLAVGARPNNASASHPVAYTFTGFVPGAPIFGHYLHGRSTVLNYRFGRATGACGTLHVRARFYPRGVPRFGAYRVQWDDSARYSSRSRPAYLTSLTFSA